MRKAVFLRRGVAIVIGAMLAAAAPAAWQTGMQEPASAIAREQQWLNLFMLGIITAIGIAVFGAMFYAVFKHRKDKGHKAANFHENTLVEIIWTTVPMIIIVLMALPATKVILAYKDTSAPDITIKVTGYQWKWSYDYLDEGVFFYSQLSTPPEQIGGKYYATDAAATAKNENYLLEVDNEMVVPVGKKIRLLLTAADVIHAWWVPQLGVKQDAVPGFVRDAWFRADRPGIYRGQCAELCGKNHGFMPIVVRAVSENDYADWLAQQSANVYADAGDIDSGKPLRVGAAAAANESAAAVEEWTMESAMALGEQQYGKFCAACHQPNGEGLPPAFPALKGGISADKGKLDEHLAIVLNGTSGTAMASFSYLSDADIAAIITYERNAWGHNTGQLLTPEAVKAAR